MRRLLAWIACAAAWTTLAAAAASDAPLTTVVLEATSAADLRAQLLARAAHDDDPVTVSRALAVASRSWERAGEADSAIAAMTRAVAAAGTPAHRLGLAELLLHRRAGDDVAMAIAQIDSARHAGLPDRAAHAEAAGLQAWAYTLAGRPDTALVIVRRFTPQLTRELRWRYRIAKIHAAAGDAPGAYDVLKPLAIAARLQDVEVNALLHDLGIGPRLEQDVERAILEADGPELAAIGSAGGRRVRFMSFDGFGLGGVLVAPERPAREPMVMIAAPGENLAVYDTVISVLRHARFPAMILDVRGSGWSVGPSCPLMETWEGRQDVMTDLVVRDVRPTLRQLVHQTGADSTHYVLVGVGDAAPIAVETAATDSAVAALVLVSPRCEESERGPMRARLASRPLPLFIQRGALDYADTELYEALYAAARSNVSRVVEGRGSGDGEQFRRDPEALPRIIDWARDRLRDARRDARR